GGGPQVAARVDERGGELRGRLARREGHERRRRREKRVGDRFVFLRLARAGRVNQAAARCDRLGRALQHRQLRRSERGQIVFATPPADVGIAPQRAESGTGRVDEHAVEQCGEGQGL